MKRGTTLGNTQRTDSGMDITWLDLEDPKHSMGDLVRTRFEEVNPKFSPDGNWIAYTSDETGRNEVYVIDFPGGTMKPQASRNPGAQLHNRWRSISAASNGGAQTPSAPVNVQSSCQPVLLR
jgi:hypothetical protein